MLLGCSGLAALFAMMPSAHAWLPHGTVASPSVGYYVNPASGNDANNGLSPATAWASLTPVAALPANSMVFLARGSVFQPANFSVPSSGMSFLPYGTGAQPVLDASTPITNWTQGTGENDTGNIFQSGFETTSFADWSPGASVPTGTSTVTQSTTEVYLGTFSCRFLGDGATNSAIIKQTCTAFAANTTYAFRMFLFVPSGQLENSASWHFLTTSKDTNIIHISTGSTGLMTSIAFNSLAAGGGQSSIATVSLAGLEGQWIRIDFVVNTSATVGGGQMWINGVSAGSNFTLDNSGNVGTNFFSLNGSANKSGGAIYFDNFVFNQQSTEIGPVPGAPNTVWYTPQATDPLMPVFPSGVQAINVVSQAACLAAGNWFWDGSTNLYVYSGMSSPGTSIGLPTNPAAITINAKQNVTLGAITVRGATGNLSGPGSGHTGGLGLQGNFSGLSITAGFMAENCYQNGVNTFENTATVTGVSVIGGTFRNNGASGFGINCSLFASWYFGMNRFYGNSCVTTLATSDLMFSGGFGCYSQFANDHGNSAPNTGQGTIFELNWCYNNGVNNTINQIGIGAHFDTVNGWTIRENNFYGNGSYGLLVEKNGSAIVYSNNCWGNAVFFPTTTGQLGLECSGGQNMTNCQIFNNTCYGNGGLSAAPFQGFGASTFSNNALTNNISVDSSTQNMTVVSPGATNTGGVGTGNTYTFNCFGAPFTNFLNWGASNYSTYAAWEAAGTPASANSVQGDPIFTNPTASPPDFSLQAGSPAIGASVAIPGYIAAGTNLGSNFAASN